MRQRVATLEASLAEERRKCQGLQQAEAQWRSIDELQAMYEGMFDGLLILEVQSKRFVKANPSICRLLGYSEQELLSMSVIDIYLPDDIPDVLQRIQSRAEGRFHGHATVRLVQKGGSLVWVDIASNPLTYGGRLCVAGFFRDMTDRKANRRVAAAEPRRTPGNV